MGTFTQNSIKKQMREKIEKSLSVIQTISHLSIGVFLTLSHRTWREEPVKPKCTKTSVWLSKTPSLIEALLCEFLRVITSEQIRSGNFERMLIVE